MIGQRLRGDSARGGVSFLALVLLLWPALFAQTPTREEPFPQLLEARRWGPFMVDLSFSIDNIGYDNNVFLVPDDDPDRPKETDFVVKLGPELRAQTNFGSRMALTIHDKLSGEVFFSNSFLNHADNLLDGQFDVLLGPLLLTTKGKWDTREYRPSSEIDERTRVDLTEYGLEARLFVGAKTDIVMRAASSDYDYTDNDSRYLIDIDGDGTLEFVALPEALDRETTTLSAEVGWRPAGKTRFLLQYREREDEFIGRSADSLVEDSRSLFGVEFRPTAFLSGKILVGRAELKSLDPNSTKRSYDDFVSDTQLVYRPRRGTKIFLDFEQDAQFSVYQNNFYFEETLAGLRVETFLGAVWGLQAGASRRELSYPEEAQERIRDPDTGDLLDFNYFREDRIEDVFGGILINLRSGLLLGIRVGVRDRISNFEPFSDKQTYVSTTGSFAF